MDEESVAGVRLKVKCGVRKGSRELSSVWRGQDQALAAVCDEHRDLDPGGQMSLRDVSVQPKEDGERTVPVGAARVVDLGVRSS